MPSTRIPIDGLWRCLCPSIDRVAIKALPARGSAARRAVNDRRPNPSQYIHTSTRRLRDTILRRIIFEPQPKDPVEPDPLQSPKPLFASRTSLGSEAERKRRYVLGYQLKDVPTAKIHDQLRRVRGEAKSYHKVVELVEYLIRERGEKPALIHYDSLIRANASAKYGSVLSVRALLEEMDVLGIVKDSGLYHGVLANHPDYLLRAEIMQEMKERWLGLSPEGWHSLVIGLIRDRQYELAMDKLEEMHSDQILVQPWLYDILTFQLVHHNELDEAFNLLKLRFDSNRDEIIPTVWYHLLDAFSSSFHYEGTKYIWTRRVETESFVVSDGICIAALNVAARYSDPELATSAIRILSSRKSALTTFHYEALLAAYAGAKDLKTAFRVLVIMTKAGLQTDSCTTRPLFMVLSNSLDLPIQAWDVLEELVQDNHAVPISAVNVVIEATISSGQFAEAVEMYKSVHDLFKISPNTETFNILLQGAARQKRKDLSMFLAGEMQALAIKPDHLTYDRLILACHNQDDYEDAFRYLEEMVGVGADHPDGGWWMRGGTAKALVQKCVDHSDERAWELLDEMDRRGMKTVSLRDWAEQHWKGPRKDPLLQEKIAMWATM
ncbi:pentatricopeptide repeat protein [Diplocarpon rosae]|nr:pentatricopeptide repeat protein [Diplocarpon rosae]